MIRYKNSIVLFAILALVVGISKLRAQEVSQPNVVFILADDLGWKDLSSYGSEFYETPHIDAFAADGIRFTDAYSAHPVCSPTRAAIMTGKDPVRVNITDWIPGRPTEQAEAPLLVPPEDIHNLPLEEITLAEAFKEHGYKTFYAGKWHLGEDPSYWPEHQGFDINSGGHDRGSPPGGYYSPYENPRLADGPEGEYLTDRLTDESIRFLQQATEQQIPFFLYLSFYTVHTPIQGCYRYDDYYREKKLELPGQGEPESRTEHRGRTRLNQSNDKFAAMAGCMDKNVGRLLEALKERDLYEDTIIIFTSDNGGLTTRDGNLIGPTAVTPLRGGKGWLYEGGIRVPLIIKGPGLPEGQISRQPVTSMDFYPTLLELAGLPARESQHVDGESVVSHLKNPGKMEERTLVWHYPHYHGSAWRPGSAIRQGRWKLIEFYEQDRVELYDLSQDLGEQDNIAGQYPEKAESLREKMHSYIQKRGGQYPQQVE